MTAQQLIEGALRLIDQLAPGYSASADHLSVGLTALNDLLETWSAEGFLLYRLAQDSLTMTGAASYTWGSGGNINTERPVKVRAAYASVSNIALPVRLATAEEWSAVIDRTATGLYPELALLDYGYPLITIRLWPNPSSGSLVFHSVKPLARVSALNSDMNLPVGYEYALRHGLAMHLAPEFRRAVPAEVVAAANAGKAALARLNAELLGIQLPPVPEVRQ